MSDSVSPPTPEPPRETNPYRHDHNPLNADITGGFCSACEWETDNAREVSRPTRPAGRGLTEAQRRAFAKDVAGGAVGFVQRMRADHGPTFGTIDPAGRARTPEGQALIREQYPDGIFLTGCRCREVGCNAWIWLAHIDDLIAAYENKVQDLAVETARADALRVEVSELREAVERMQPVVDAAQHAHPKHCPRSGHWQPWGGLTEADRPARYADSRTRRIYCSDDQCQNPDHVQFARCNDSWHDMDEALAAHRAAVAARVVGVVADTPEPE